MDKDHDDNNPPHRNPAREGIPDAAEKAYRELGPPKGGQESKEPGKQPPEPPPRRPNPPAPPEAPDNIEFLDRLPPFARACDIPPDLPKRIALEYPELVQGLIHRGTKVVLGGASKSFKSWLMLDLGLALATGREFFGRATQPGPVVWINLEIPDLFAMQRVKQVCEARGMPLPENFFIWSLRGHCSDFSVLAPVLKVRAQEVQAQTGQDVSAVLLDPLYKGLGDRDENAAGDMASLMAELDEICKASGAALVFSHHFAKGNAALKEAQDRMSGSGVISRDADTIMVLTPHEEDYAYTVSTILRSLPPVQDFVLRWNFPVFVPDNRLDPDALRKPGRQKTIDPQKILELLPEEGLRSGQWQRLCEEAGLCKRRAFYEVLRELEREELVEKDLSGQWRRTAQ